MKNSFDDIGEEWLKENDPLYGKRKQSGYLTSGMMAWTQHIERPLSGLTPKEQEQIMTNNKKIT